MRNESTHRPHHPDRRGIVLRQRASRPGRRLHLVDPRFEQRGGQPASTHRDRASLGSSSTRSCWTYQARSSGVYKGTSLTQIAKFFPDTTVHGFDSFLGLRLTRWGGTGPTAAETRSTLGASTPASSRCRNVEFRVGLVRATPSRQFSYNGRLRPRWPSASSMPTCYSSTKTVFDSPGDWFDRRHDRGLAMSYFGYHGWRAPRTQGIRESSSSQTGLTFEAISLGHMNLAVRSSTAEHPSTQPSQKVSWPTDLFDASSATRPAGDGRLHSRTRSASLRGGCTLATLKSFYGVDIGEPSGSTAAPTAEIVEVFELLKPNASKTPLIRIGGDRTGHTWCPTTSTASLPASRRV